MLKIIKLNNKEVEEKLKTNSNYCPCAFVKNQDTKCMCKEFREQESGICHCELYEKIIIQD